MQFSLSGRPGTPQTGYGLGWFSFSSTIVGIGVYEYTHTQTSCDDAA